MPPANATACNDRTDHLSVAEVATEITLYHGFGCWRAQIAFRGQFVKVMFAYTKTPYTMGATSEMLAMKNEPSAEGGLFMGPPLLRDEEDDLWLSQMPAVVQHLARKMDLVPASGKAQSQALKILLDCNDVLGDVTRANG